MKNVGLDKRKLKNVAIDEIDDNYISQIEADIKYFVTAKIININKFSILVISFFKNSNIKYRVFIDKKNKEYISQDYTEDVNKPKWRTAKIENLILKYHYNWWEKCLIIKSSGEKILKYLNKNKNPLLSIDEFQNHILKEKLRIKNQKIIDRIDEQMKMVPKLPKSFSKWINDTVLLSSRYIYYKYKRGNKPMEGYCTHCKQNVLVNKPRHNAKGTCPNCKSKIIFKATGKSKNVSDKGYCTIIQKVKTGLVIRYFSVSKHYSNYKNPELYIGENLRDFYEDNSTKVKEYEYRYFKQTGDLRWCEGILTGFWTCPYNFENIVLYTRNLTKVLQKTRWKYSQIKQFAAYKNKDGFNVYRYIESYKRYPFIEYLVKLELYNLVENIINMDSYSIKDIFNLSGKKFNDILKLNKSYIPRLQKLNVNVSELKILQYAYKKNIHITDDQIEFIYKNQINPSGLMEISKYSNLNKCIKYLKKQSKIEDKKISNVYIGWKDYIKNCKLMQYDLTNEFILFPKNLKREHDKVMKLVKIENTKKLNRLIEQKHEILSKLYEFEYKDFFIAVAKNADEIIKEGQNLHHCVGGISYLEGMALGNNNIIFIRKKQEPSKSFYTMEIQTSRNKIIQCRGKTNDDMTPEVEEFVEKFKNKKLNKIHRNKAV